MSLCCGVGDFVSDQLCLEWEMVMLVWCKMQLEFGGWRSSGKLSVSVLRILRRSLWKGREVFFSLVLVFQRQGIVSIGLFFFQFCCFGVIRVMKMDLDVGIVVFGGLVV